MNYYSTTTELYQGFPWRFLRLRWQRLENGWCAVSPVAGSSLFAVALGVGKTSLSRWNIVEVRQTEHQVVFFTSELV